MNWESPIWLLGLIPAWGLLWWFSVRSFTPMSGWRRNSLFFIRALLLLLLFWSLTGPSLSQSNRSLSVIFILDHSDSQSEVRFRDAANWAHQQALQLPRETQIGFLSAGETPLLLQTPQANTDPLAFDWSVMEQSSSKTDLGAALMFASGMFPADTERKIVLVSDGLESKGDARAIAERLALQHITVDTVPWKGRSEPDVRVTSFAALQNQPMEGTRIQLEAKVESSFDGRGMIRLFENGIEVEKRELKVHHGKQNTVLFERIPPHRNLYTYRAQVGDFENDTNPANNEELAVLDVQGPPLLLYLEGEDGEAEHLLSAMNQQGFRIQVRSPAAFPRTLEQLRGIDGIIISDVPAPQLTSATMRLIQKYVEELGGGLIMIGGKNSFGAGGYHRTLMEEMLPVKMKAPDKEERFTRALILVLDRSGSMRGKKIEICKSAASATVDLLKKKDYLGVIAFDSTAQWIVPMTRASFPQAIHRQIATLHSGGGTNLYPGMSEAKESLSKVKAKIKHMIVMTDGQTSGSGYQELASQLKKEGVTVSTVAVQSQDAAPLLKKIASTGGGKFYETDDPDNLPQIFTQDAMMHMGQLIREESFAPKQIQPHPMVQGLKLEDAPQLLGYVKTDRKSMAQTLWVTDQDDPLLAHWQYGLGKVTAFTSDCKSSWSALWLTNWEGYSQFWSQVLKETARDPQGHNIELGLKKQTHDAIQIEVLLKEDAAHWKNNAEVSAELFFAPQQGSGELESQETFLLSQVGPGRYETSFQPREPGLYFVRVQSGGERASSGLFHQNIAEGRTGLVNESLLRDLAELTGGNLMNTSEHISLKTEGKSRTIDLIPWLIKLALVLFVLDLCIRRWENILGVCDLFARD